MKLRAALISLVSLVMALPLIAQVAEKPQPSAPSKKLRLVTEQMTNNYIPMFQGTSGALTDSPIFWAGSAIVVDTNLQLQSSSGGVPRLYLAYPALAGYGTDFTSTMGGVEMFSVGFNSQATYSGTIATASGRQMYFYDRVANAYRGVIDGQGTWWFGSAPTNYGLKVLAPSGSTTGMMIDAAGKVGIGGASDSNYRLKVVGDANFVGTVTGTNIKAHYQDVAEWVSSTTDLAPGTVVILNREGKNEVMASATAYDTTVAGVVSAQPGISLGFEGEGKEQIATTGRVKVRVDARNKPVRVGDLLVTSDLSGTAMRSEPMDLNGRPFHQPGTIIGKALEPLDGGVGEILVLLSMQ